MTRSCQTGSAREAPQVRSHSSTRAALDEVFPKPDSIGEPIGRA